MNTQTHIQVFFAIFFPLIFALSTALGGMYYMYTSQIDALDQHVFEKALENSWEEFEDDFENIISRNDWNTLSLRQIDKKLIQNNIDPIGDANDSFYFLTPQEIEQQFLEENISIAVDFPNTQQNNAIKTPQESYTIKPSLGLQELQEIEDGISEEGIISFGIIFSVLCFFIGAIAWIFARKSINPLEKALQKQKEFVANVSHELRTPLTMIKTEAEVLLQSGEKNISEYLHFTKNIITDVNQLDSLATNLLELSKLENKNSRPSIRKNISSDWKRIYQRFFLRTEQEKKLFHMNKEIIDTNITIPSIGFEACIQILLDNACKHTNSNDTISVSFFLEEKFFVIEVSDTGEGIEQNFLETIFERFTKSDTSRNSSGFGLGLSLLYESMHSIGGRVRIKSTKGKGSTFRVYFPK